MRLVIIGGIVAFACTVALAQPKAITEFTGRVVGVSDGDTAKVLVGKETVTVRLEGIDAPETGQAFGTRARQALSSYVFGKTVMVRKTGEDRYDRTLGFLIEGKTDVNARMVEDGFAWHYKKYNSDPILANLEREARVAKRGLWSDPNPIAPWDYRALKRTPKVEGGGTGEYWLNTASNVRHNSTCESFKNTKQGRLCGKDDGKARGRCGG
jgi:endonuclease YncB( thermonuclease family)